MPEGDTILRAARTLHRALAGATVTGFTARLPQLAALPVPGDVVGRAIEGVEPRGKHVLMRFSAGLVLRSHLRMHGSWHLYRPGERWRARRADMRVLVETLDWHAVAFRLPVAEWLTDRAIDRDPVLAALGPDLLDMARFDPTVAVDRLAQRRDQPVEEALLDQRVMAGIGNVFKSEVLFACRVHPFARVGDLDRSTLESLVGTAVRQLRANVTDDQLATGGRRRTTNRLSDRESLWVYRRAGRPCHRCGSAIEWRRSGGDARSTYWCPTCQPAHASRAGSGTAPAGYDGPP